MYAIGSTLWDAIDVGGRHDACLRLWQNERRLRLWRISSDRESRQPGHGHGLDDATFITCLRGEAILV